MRAIDLHQHLWPEPLLALLRARREPPRLHGSRLEVPGEAAREIDLEAHRPEQRVALLDRLGIERAAVSLPPTLGLDELPAGEAAELAAAFEQGAVEVAAATGGRLVPLAAGDDPAGFPGACVSARRLVDLAAAAPLLDALARAGGFLLVHPGPAPAPPGRPSWWTPVVGYTAQLQEAYAAWLAEGAERWPGLRVVFAHLAGGGPFQLERLLAFGVGSRELALEHVYLETSSYGRRALELCLATFGVERLVFGTDVPTLDGERALHAVRWFGEAVEEALCVANPRGLLG
ncbi:MAG TPA: amidohydrolase family protein [Gaiellaceae bacterium]|nr:amidohydrolase family protein [Gaiellaceae bacterium]